MQLSAEARTQLSEQKKQCVFCKIVSKEIQSQIVFEDKSAQAILDIYPVVKGHILFFPKEHYPLLMYFEPVEIAPYYALVPQMVKAVKAAMVSTGVNVFIASGGSAGQQSPHFVSHIIPREPGDGFLNFLFKMKILLSSQTQQKMITTFPQAFKQYFGSLGVEVPSQGSRPAWLELKISGALVLFEDSEVLVCAPGKGLVEGHVEMYSKIEQKLVEKLSSNQAIHFFSIAAYVSSVLFSLLQLQGTNFILKSGTSDDNKEGVLCMNIIPRKQGDSLQGLLWQPVQAKYDLAPVAGKMKDSTWSVKYSAPKVTNNEQKGEASIKKGMVVDVPSRTILNTSSEIDEAVRKFWK